MTMRLWFAVLFVVACSSRPSFGELDAGHDATIVDASVEDTSCKPSRDELCGSMLCGYAGDDSCGHHVDCGKCGPFQVCGTAGPLGGPAVVGQCGCPALDYKAACAKQDAGTCGRETNGCDPNDPKFAAVYDCDSCGFPSSCADLASRSCSKACTTVGATAGCANTGYPTEVDCSPADALPGGSMQSAANCIESGASQVTSFWCCK